MPEVKKIIHHKKQFLNLRGHHSDASLFTEADITTWSKGAPEVNAYANIRDCNHEVRIALSFGTRGEYKNSLRKVKLIKNQFTKLEKDLTIVWKEYEKMRKAYKEREKKKRLKKKTSRD